MAKKTVPPAAPEDPDFNTREILDLLDRELNNAKECDSFDDDAIKAYGLKMFVHGYQHARLLLSRAGGNA